MLKSVVGASVRKAYKESGRPIWDVLRADDDIEKAVRGAFVSPTPATHSSLTQH